MPPFSFRRSLANRAIFGRTRLDLLLGLLRCWLCAWCSPGSRAAPWQIFLSQRQRQRPQPCDEPGRRLSICAPGKRRRRWRPGRTAEENEYARDAERLADHEVDQAFASALRQANLQAQHRVLTGDALALSQKVAQLKQLVKQDQAQVDSLTAASRLQSQSRKRRPRSPPRRQRRS